VAELQRDDVDAPDVPAKPRQTGRAQYSLASLFGFTVACGAYLSTLTVLARLRPSWQLSWHPASALVVAWLLLAVFYVRQDERVILVLHCLGLAFAGVCLPFVIAGYGEQLGGTCPRTSPETIIAHTAAFSCAAGTLASLPAFVWVLLVLGVRSIFRSLAKRES